MNQRSGFPKGWEGDLGMSSDGGWEGVKTDQDATCYMYQFSHNECLFTNKKKNKKQNCQIIIATRYNIYK